MSHNAIYRITKNTLALIPAKSPIYSTIAIETNQCHFLIETPLEIIQAACKINYTTYHTIRNIISEQTGFKKLIPIPIHLQTGLILFPTHATTHHECSWIIYSNHLTHNYHNHKTTLNLKPHQQLTLNISPHTLKKLITRAFEVQFRVMQHFL